MAIEILFRLPLHLPWLLIGEAIYFTNVLIIKALPTLYKKKNIVVWLRETILFVHVKYCLYCT